MHRAVFLHELVRAEGTQVIGTGVSTPFPRTRRSLRLFSDPQPSGHETMLQLYVIVFK